MTQQQKIKKTMQEFSCSKKSAIGIVHMLDWMTENESNLMSLHKQFEQDTKTQMPFNEFCYGMWPHCRVGYLAKKKKPEFKNSAIQAQG